MSDFNSAVQVILAHEGGWVNDPQDPGGATNFGISLRFLQQKGISLNGHKATAEDVHQMTREQAAWLYRKWFWDAFGYGRIPDQVLATKVFDICVNSGPHEAHLLLQRGLTAIGHSVDVDGELGPKTWNAILAADPRRLTQAVCVAQADFYRELVRRKPNLSKFLGSDEPGHRSGWLKRAAWPN